MTAAPIAGNRGNLSPLVGISELANILGMHRSTLYRSIDAGRFPLPVVRIGARITVPRAAVEKLFAHGGEHALGAAGNSRPTDHCPCCGAGVSSPRTRPTCSAARRSSSGIASV